GKTRVLTHRIAHLVHSGRARPGEILAITFTNKAAQEMRERVEMLVGNRTRAMWVMTFHSACARMLRSDAHRLGYTRGFTIYDEQDSVRLVKRCIEELDVDPKRFTPRAIKRQISDAKNQLLDASGYREKVGSFFEQTAADVFELYEQRAHGMNAMDFDDLLVRTVNLLELFPEVRERYQHNFQHVLVDEYQDTNRAQYRWLQILAEEHRNLCVVGDDAQCLVEGTQVTMGDGTLKPIEDVVAGDEVLSCMGSGQFAPARVDRIYRSTRADGLKITTEGGREIVSTPEHTHFAGYRNGLTPPMFMTYAMRKNGVGARVGMTRTLVNSRGQTVAGVQARAMTEKAEGAWVLSTHHSEADARVHEAVVAATYGLPTIPFVARAKSGTGLMARQELIDSVYADIDSERGGLALLDDQGHSIEEPHHAWQGFEGKRRNVVVTLCADRNGADHRGAEVLHTVSAGGRDSAAREQLERLGFRTTHRNGASGWRASAYFKTFEEADAAVERIENAMDVSVRYVARLGRPVPGTVNSLPFQRASSVRPGMAMFTADGGYDIVTKVERVALTRPVFDLDIDATHNFVANGLVTHNSIYGFRGADIGNVLNFEDDFPDAQVIKLEQNYRSTQTILSAANALIENNRSQKRKELWTDAGQGDLVTVRELEDEHAEARYVAGEIERLVDAGGSRDEVAVFYRANAQSRVLEDTLVRYGVGYQVIGGTRFYERAEIKDALGYLTFIVNPHDLVAFQRVVNSPRRGIGDTSQARIGGHANTIGEPIWDVASRPADIPGLGAAAIKAVDRFMSVMERLRERADGAAPVGDLLDETLTETGFTDALKAERTIEAEGRLENLEELVSVAREYDAQAEEPSVEEFLQQVALFSEQDNLTDEEGIVTLMTLHNAKGLEYPLVFMIGMEDGVFPHMRSIEAGDIEEERRLCYVGVTRAMRKLYLTHARTRAMYGGREWNVPSRFLGEIPPELTDQEDAEGAPSITSWSEGGAGMGSPAPRNEGASFNVGDDVVHAVHGDGVVIGAEADVVVVRFRGDGSERKLMVDYAPLKKA
ncbi:MAG: UvrD-helicase domain-containing protein, partial [Actinomycetota bacterium]